MFLGISIAFFVPVFLAVVFFGEADRFFGDVDFLFATVFLAVVFFFGEAERGFLVGVVFGFFFAGLFEADRLGDLALFLVPVFFAVVFFFGESDLDFDPVFLAVVFFLGDAFLFFGEGDLDLDAFLFFGEAFFLGEAFLFGEGDLDLLLPREGLAFLQVLLVSACETTYQTPVGPFSLVPIENLEGLKPSADGVLIAKKTIF